MIDASDAVPAGQHPDERTAAVCPPWCELPTGHPFTHPDPDDPGLTVREHWRSVHELAAIAAEERAVADDGPAWSTSRPYVTIDPTIEVDHLQPEAARRLHEALTAALEALESLA